MVCGDVVNTHILTANRAYIIYKVSSCTKIDHEDDFFLFLIGGSGAILAGAT